MKKISLLAIVAVVSLGIAFTSCNSNKSMGPAKLTSDMDSFSYILGKVQGYTMMKQTKMTMEEGWPEKGNFEYFVIGLYDALQNPDDSLFFGRDVTELNNYLNETFQSFQAKAAETIKAEGDKFLAENKTKSGVITTQSGLQYKVITEGTGPKPVREDQVKVHYLGKLLDGTEFDSSYGNGEPVTFPLANVIPGWTEGVQLMPVGSKYIMWIPGEIAYGMNPPQGSLIKPMATLEFEVELLEIVK